MQAPEEGTEMDALQFSENRNGMVAQIAVRAQTLAAAAGFAQVCSPGVLRQNGKNQQGAARIPIARQHGEQK